MRRRIFISVSILIFLACTIYFLYAWVAVLNEDYFSRATQTLHLDKSISDQKPTEGDPILRFVVHRLIQEENSAEVSLILVLDTHSPMGSEIEANSQSIVAHADDGSSADLYGAHAETSVLSSADFIPGHKDAVARSSRLVFPTFSSVNAFPFDKISLRPMFKVTTNERRWHAHQVEIQKAFPGRKMTARWDNGGVVIHFSRSNLEIVYILGVSFIFLAATSLVFVSSLINPRSSIGIDHIVSIAGLLVAAAGYREILGVSKLPGTSVLEIVVLGFPLIILTANLVVSIYKSRIAGNNV